jgi:hypothetical protein
MPLLPKRPTTLMHFDHGLTDYTTDVLENLTEILGNPNAGGYLVGGLDSVKNSTFELTNRNIIINDGSQFDISKSFTFRFWERAVSASGWNGKAFHLSTGSSVHGLALYHYAGMDYIYASTNGASWNLISGAGIGAVQFNLWTHWEFGFDADTLKLYVFRNGNLVYNPALGGIFYFNPTSSHALGDTGLTTSIADFDFISGVCEHTEGFTPLPRVSQIKQLRPLYSDARSKFGNGSLYSNGNAYLSFTSTDSLLNTNNDFTISFWEYFIAPIGESGSLTVNGAVTSNQVAGGLLFGYNYGGNKLLYMGSGNSWDLASGVLLTSAANVLNRWAHWEISYESATQLFRVFLDGAIIYTLVCPRSIRMGATNYSRLGHWGNPQHAHYDELLVLPGVCLHTSNFTPPDEPYTAPKVLYQGMTIGQLHSYKAIIPEEPTVLPKRPVMLLHFDSQVVNYWEDIGNPSEVGGSIGNAAAISDVSELQNETLYIDGSHYVRIINPLDISGSFTVRFWEYLISHSPGYSSSLALSASSISSSMYGGVLFGYTTPNSVRYLYASSNGVSWDQISTYSLGASEYGKWVNWEIGFDINTKTLYVFKDGILLNAFALSESLYFNPTMFSYLGYPWANGLSSALYADFEFIQGICEHSGNFTPREITSRTMTKSTSPLISPEQSKFGSSLFLNGSNYFQSNIALDTNRDFTVSFWEYVITPTEHAASLVINFNSTSGGGAAILLGYNYIGNKLLYLSTGTSNNWDVLNQGILEPIANVLNRWAHWEISYESATQLFRVFLDGTIRKNIVCPAPLRSGGTLSLGRWGGSLQSAYYDELLVLPGVCLHKEEYFFPPKRPYTLPDEALIYQTIDLTNNKSDGYRGTRQGMIINTVHSGTKELRSFFGVLLDMKFGNKPIKTNQGLKLYLSSGEGRASKSPGKNLDFLLPDSSGICDFDLLVTPTHIYKNQFAHVAAKYKLPQGLIGQYQLKVKDEVAIPWGASTDISTVDFSITQSMLEYGKNPCRLEYLYPDGQSKYLDFEVTREEPKRTHVERTFESYDGGYDGNRMLSASGYYPFSPCFLVPDGQLSTLIKTTDFTKVPLQKYTGVQGVQIDASGAKILVTFDNGLTWKSLVDNSWQSVSLDNIAVDGMTPELINSTVFARWLEIFKPVSLNFAVHLLNSVYNPGAVVHDVITTGQGQHLLSWSVPDGMVFTKIDASTTTWDSRYPAGIYTYKDGVLIEGYSQNRVNVPIIFNRDYFGIPMDERPDTINFSSYASHITLKAHAAPRVAYLKSITADITPRLKTGYAFIM